MLSGTAGGCQSETREQVFPLQAEFSPQASCKRPVQGQSGPGVWEHRDSEGKGGLTCQRLGSIQQLPPGSRPGRWTGPWASGPRSHTSGPPGGRGRGSELKRLDSPGGRGGGRRGARWEGPGHWGRAAGLVTSGVVTPCLNPSMAPYCPQVQDQALSGLICLLCFGPSAAATPRWHLLPTFPRPLPSRSTERPLLLAGMGRLSRSPSFAGCCLWEPSDSPLSPLRLLGGESCPSCSSRAARVSDLL